MKEGRREEKTSELQLGTNSPRALSSPKTALSVLYVRITMFPIQLCTSLEDAGPKLKSHKDSW